MSGEAPKHEPSVSSLADALARVAPPPDDRIAIARPRLLIRMLLAAVLLLSLLFVTWLLVLGARVGGLVGEMRAERAERERRARETLPSEAVLRDPAAARNAAAARPQAAPRLWLARAELLARDGDWAGVEALAAEVALASPGDLLPATSLLRAEALHRLGRPAEAARVLHAIDGTLLDEAGRARAAALGAALWRSVEGAAQQPDQAAPEGAGQLDPR